MKNKTSNIAIVILAAGASSRMGSPKQLLNWGDDSLIRHAIHTALELQYTEVIVVLGANYDLIETKIKDLPITILKNEYWNLGLGKSIACAADYVLKSKPKTQGLLITLADQPLIDSSFLNTIIQGFLPRENQIIATSYNDDKKGVPVLFDAIYFKKLSELSHDNGAKELLKAHESLVKTLKPPVKNVDLDSKEDYENLLKANFKI